MRNKKNILFFSFAFILISYSCKRDVPIEYVNSNYPIEIRNILVGKCATSGCHNTASKDAAEGLDLSSWNKLFEGGRNGAAVIPYKADQSYLMFFVNIYSDLGTSLKPTMPYGIPTPPPPLTREEILTLKNWIANGAPDKNGFVKFSDNPYRKKFYVANQGCDLVGVYDADTKLIMRYVDVGVSAGTEAPHMIRVSPDGQYWYVVFYNGSVIQKFRTSDDVKVGEINIGYGLWNTITISKDSKNAFVVDWEANGKVAYVDLENMTLISLWQGSMLFEYPHGSAINMTSDTLYLTAQTGNYIYKVPINDPASAKKISLNGSAPTTISSLDPHEIIFSSDEKKYFVICQKSNEVRVMQTSNDSLLAVIPVGNFPQELSISKTTPYLFVTCMEDTIQITSGRGSVAIINYNTNTLIKSIFTGWQPHGIAVDDYKKIVYVANRNKSTNGHSPHHSSGCGGRNGYISIIDMISLELIPYMSETSVDPFSVAIRN